MAKSQNAIGIFDSGVGGLTVLRRISERLPAESIVYLGDTARVPYGTKSDATVIRYARACSAFLLDREIKLLVVACNTASAYALDALRSELAIPVLGVIEPGAQAAVHATRNGRIGVIGTAGTIKSGAYTRAIQAAAPQTELFCTPCPLFVPLAEEGWTDGPVPRGAAEVYLGEILRQGIDTLILGCTHYPLLKSVIRDTTGDAVQLVDSAEATSYVVAETLERMGLLAPGNAEPTCRLLVSDSPETFARVGKRFLGREIGCVEWVDIQ